MNGRVTLKPSNWQAFHGWEVFDGDDYLGLIGQHGTEGDRRFFRAYGVGESLDGDPVSVEHEFPTRDEAVDWLLDGDNAEAEYDGAGS